MMAFISFNVHEAKTRLSELLERAASGEKIVIAKAGKPVAELVPIVSEKRKPGIAKGRVTDAFFDPLPEEELRAWNT